MIGIRIVCTHDAVKTAETLMRLLAAEEHPVRLSYGRQSLNDLQEAVNAREVVLLIWSFDAPSAHYMLQWAASADPSRLIEVARAPGWPKIEGRLAPVIDFSAWRGERGGRCWNSLIERVRTVARICEPPKPPPRRAAMALGLASMAAVGGALFIRVNEALQTPDAVPMQQTVIASNASDGIGGPISVIEPASIDDYAPVHFGPHTHAVLIDSTPQLADVPELVTFEIRTPPTLLERLNEVASTPINEISAALRGPEQQTTDQE